jgi:tRNA/rRNA methyltransferase
MASADTRKIRLDHIAVVLNQPQIPENIGAAARAMRNMGVHELVVVDPNHFDYEPVLKLATHAASDVVASMRLCPTLKEALAPYRFVVGTTARLGGQRRVCDPAVMARKLIPISRENRIALVFGREDRGLSNENLRLCHGLVNIPTADFSSLNLAQAVMVLCYEMSRAATDDRRPFTPKLANRYELDGMYDQLREILIRICYLNPENPDYWMNHLRNFFTRLGLRAREVSIIRGIIRQVNWYSEKRYRDGLEEGLEKAREKETCN